MPYNDPVFLKRLIELLTRIIATPDSTPNGRLYLTAVCSLGMDASPNDEAPDELGCAETVDTIYKKAFGQFITGSIRPTLSTTVLYKHLLKGGMWEEVMQPVQGCIVISPTGWGTNPIMPHGHVGYVSSDSRIMSNDSATGYFMENYTLESWRKRYVLGGGFPMRYFKRRKM